MSKVNEGFTMKFTDRHQRVGNPMSALSENERFFPQPFLP